MMEAATEPKPTATAPGSPPAIAIRELRRDYGERPVLRGLTLDVGVGDTLAVLGPNGAGKSTLLRILATLLRPTSGGVSVLGSELPRGAWKVRGRVGYVGHQPLLYRELSVRENLEFNARLHTLADPEQRIDELLERAGLARRGDELVRNLSAGMAQRAAICRAVLHQPALLLLDEPRSHLDLGAADRLEDLLAAAPGRTRVIVSHDIERGLAEADEALALTAAGRPAYAGPARGISAAELRTLYSGAVM